MQFEIFAHLISAFNLTPLSTLLNILDTAVHSVQCYLEDYPLVYLHLMLLMPLRQKSAQ